MTWPLGWFVALFAAGLACSLVLTGTIRRAARRAGLVDRPDGRRKVHSHPIPVAGGLAVFITTGCVLVTAALLPHQLGAELRARAFDLGALALAAGLICALGVVDDARGLPGWQKLGGQCAAVAVVMLTGPQITSVTLFDNTVELGYFAVPLTLFWLLGAINSLNLLDGMDGLLGTVATIICVAIAGMAALHRRPLEACVAVTLAGALMGFLRYNLPPASIFLGDAGSMLIGLVIGELAIRSSLKGPATVALAAPAALLVLPIFDTLAAVVRRKLTGRSIFSTDRGHLHHCLQRGGMSRPRVLLVVAGLCTVAVLGALGSLAHRNEMLAVASAGVVVAVLTATRIFGHAELLLLVQSGHDLARSVLGSSGAGHQSQVRIQGVAAWDELWSRLTNCAPRLNLRSVALEVNAPAYQEAYHARWSGPARAGDPGGPDPSGWSVVLPLTAGGQEVGRLTVHGRWDGVAVWKKVAALSAITGGAEALLGPLAGRPGAPGT